MSKIKSKHDLPLSDYVQDLKSALEKSEVHDEKVLESLNDLQDAVLETRKTLRSFVLFCLVTIILCIAGLIVMGGRNEALKFKLDNMEYRDSLFHVLMGVDSSQIISYQTRDNKPVTYWQLANELDLLERQTRSFQYRDSIFSALLTVDKEGVFYYRAQGDKPVTYDELVKENDAYIREINHLHSLIQQLENRDSVARQLLWVSDQGHITYLVGKDKKPINYNTLAHENDSLLILVRKASNDADNLRIQLELITKNYPISIITQDNKYILKASKVDSALAILPVYRDMIKYDEDKRAFLVTRKH